MPAGLSTDFRTWAEKCSFFYYHIQEEEVELQGIENKKTNEKYLSIKKTLHMMKDLMDKATEKSN